MSDLSLKVAGNIHLGWTGVSVRHSLEQIANSFELTLTARWDESDKTSPIPVGETCEILIDDKLLMTGFIDDITPSYDAKSHSIIVAGRSKTADLVDCSGLGKQYKELTFQEIAADVCSQFGISVIDEAANTEKFRLVMIEAGESYFEFLARLAAIRAVRLQPTAKGELLITRAGTDRIETPLELGNNILSASGQFSHRDRFSEYTVQGQQPGDDVVFGAEAAHISATATDGRIKRHRPTLIMADNAVTIGDCQNQSRWHTSSRFGRGLMVVYTVNGWSHSGGLWAVNSMVPVKDQWLGIDEIWLIVSVQFTLDENGEKTELQVMPKEAFELLELPIPAASGNTLWGQ